MRTCNKCQKIKADDKFKNKNKKTCLKCEYRFKQRILRYLVNRKKLTPSERMASRIGYMGSGFLIAAQWTIEPVLYIVGFICVIIQVFTRKQWNLVALNINGLIAWVRHLIF
jgi:hypothetical protein